jgi:hypothetical protein
MLRLAASYILLCLGSALWLYSYFAPRVPPLMDHDRHVPAWVAAYLPSIWITEHLPSLAQFGLFLIVVGALALFWLLLPGRC